jgi:hypothetical protein
MLIVMVVVLARTGLYSGLVMVLVIHITTGTIEIVSSNYTRVRAITSFDLGSRALEIHK